MMQMFTYSEALAASDIDYELVPLLYISRTRSRLHILWISLQTYSALSHSRQMRVWVFCSPPDTLNYVGSLGSVNAPTCTAASHSRWRLQMSHLSRVPTLPLPNTPAQRTAYLYTKVSSAVLLY